MYPLYILNISLPNDVRKVSTPSSLPPPHSLISLAFTSSLTPPFPLSLTLYRLGHQIKKVFSSRKVSYFSYLQFHFSNFRLNAFRFNPTPDAFWAIVWWGYGPQITHIRCVCIWTITPCTIEWSRWQMTMDRLL